MDLVFIYFVQMYKLMMIKNKYVTPFNLYILGTVLELFLDVFECNPSKDKGYCVLSNQVDFKRFICMDIYC